MEPQPRQPQSSQSWKIFLGLFVGVGVLVLGFGLKALLSKSSHDAPGLLITGVMFTSIPLLMMRLMSRQQKQTVVAVQKQLADPMPWLCRADWAKREIEAKEIAPPFVLFLGAAVAAGFGFFMTRSFSGGQWNSLFNWMPAIFSVVPVTVMLVMGCRAVARQKNFGKSVFKLSSETGVIGGKLEGNICGESRIEQPGRFTVRLVCYNQTGGGDSSKVRKLWEEKQTVSAASGVGSFVIPVSIAIPTTCEETDMTTPDNLLFWRLEASADARGVNYQARFEVPVFKTHRDAPPLAVS